MTELRRRMDEDMVVRGFAERTRETVSVRQSPDLARALPPVARRITDEEVQAYLRYLIRDRQRSWNTCHIVVHGLRFFYHTTLKRDRTTFTIPVAAPTGQAPGDLESGGRRAGDRPHDESEASHDDPDDLRGRPATERSAPPAGRGYRLGADDDSRGAGQRGQGPLYRALAPRLLEALRVYWKATRPAAPWLFPSARRPQPIDPSRCNERIKRRTAGWHHETRRDSRAPSRVCDPPARSGGRPPHDPTVARARRHQYRRRATCN